MAVHPEPILLQCSSGLNQPQIFFSSASNHSFTSLDHIAGLANFSHSNQSLFYKPIPHHLAASFQIEGKGNDISPTCLPKTNPDIIAVPTHQSPINSLRASEYGDCSRSVVATSSSRTLTDFSISKLLGLCNKSYDRIVAPQTLQIPPCTDSLAVDCSSPDSASSSSGVSSCSCSTPPAISSVQNFATFYMAMNSGVNMEANMPQQHDHQQVSQKDRAQLTSYRRRARKNRTVYEPEQVASLERLFARSPYLVADDRDTLSRQLGLTEIQIKIWFQNRRSKHHREVTKRRGGKGTSSNPTKSPAPDTSTM